MLTDEKTYAVEYKCEQCGQRDADKLWIGEESPSPAITCWNCKAGHGLSPQDQVHRGAGMMLVQPGPETVH